MANTDQTAVGLRPFVGFQTRAISWCAKAYAMFLLTGLDRWRRAELHAISDGRTRKAVGHWLVKQGYAEATKEGIFATDKAYQLCEAVKPEIVVEKVRNLDFTHAENYRGWHLVDAMDASHLRYVIEHPGEFLWVLYDKWTRTETRIADISAAITEASAAGRYIVNDLYIQTPEFLAARDALGAEQRLQQAYDRHLSWGAETLGLVPEGKGAVLTSGVGWDLNTNCRTPDSYDLDKELEHAKSELKTAMERVEILIKAQDKVAQLGGWEAFKQLYRKALVDEIANQDD